MSVWKAERNQLTCAAFYFLWGSEIVQNNKRVCSLKQKLAAKFKLDFELLLRAENDKNSRIVIHKSVVGFVVDKGWAYWNRVVKRASKTSLQLVHEVLGFAGVCQDHDQGVKRNVFSGCIYILMCLAIMFIWASVIVKTGQFKFP